MFEVMNVSTAAASLHRPSMPPLPRFSWSQTCLYHGASETDLITFAGNVSLQVRLHLHYYRRNNQFIAFQVCKLSSELDALLSQSSKASLLLLLGSGGVGLYVYYSRKKRKKCKDESPKRGQRWRKSQVSWFRWLFYDDEETVIEDPDDSDIFLVQGNYFFHFFFFKEIVIKKEIVFFIFRAIFWAK